MTSKAYKEIKKGLEDALAHAKGDKTAARTHVIEVPAKGRPKSDGNTKNKKK